MLTFNFFYPVRLTRYVAPGYVGFSDLCCHSIDANDPSASTQICYRLYHLFVACS